VREALAALHVRQMAVLTNKPVKFSQAILVGLGLNEYFMHVYGGNSFERKKPDPVGLFTLMSETKVPADRTMIVGDSDTDVLTGRNAGVWTCGVTYGLAPQTFETSPPDLLLNDLRERPPLLQVRAVPAAH
jgi:phosphoglycolate phosphatase